MFLNFLHIYIIWTSRRITFNLSFPTLIPSPLVKFYEAKEKCVISNASALSLGYCPVTYVIKNINNNYYYDYNISCDARPHDELSCLSIVGLNYDL